MEKLSDMLEQREAQVNEILAAAQLDPEAVVNVNEKLEVRNTREPILCRLRGSPAYFRLLLKFIFNWITSDE